ncbi:hypothetical protein [Fulvivirga aurantia]|uniref:hypothetical protein n=1 Tax=Fulvivirga aurantia TaxID=2529383 RepID=UPI0012BBE066|nr:hypothetical protein [Fulvivirga aurantia]
MTAIKHDIWQDEDGLTMLCMAGELGKESRTLLEPNSRIIHSFKANSHFDAMTQYYTYMEWGQYESEFEEDKQPFQLKELSSREKLRVQIDKILWEDWDPIGINDVAPRDEYQSYVPQILNIALIHKSAGKIAERLYLLESKTIGVGGNLSRCRKVAEKIMKQHANICFK